MLASCHVFTLLWSGGYACFCSLHGVTYFPPIFGSASSATGSAIFASFVQILNDTLHIIPRFMF